MMKPMSFTSQGCSVIMVRVIYRVTSPAGSVRKAWQIPEAHPTTHKPHLSEDFRSFFERQSTEEPGPLFQHEISVLIKGRADDQFDEYKKLDSLLYGLPLKNDADKGLVFNVFLNYQKQLETVNQFDTDDVVLSAVGQLHTPIWRRRRAKEGYDFIAIDETHLFNINELHIFHHFTRGVGFSRFRSLLIKPKAWGIEEGVKTTHSLNFSMQVTPWIVLSM